VNLDKIVIKFDFTRIKNDNYIYREIFYKEITKENKQEFKKIYNINKKNYIIDQVFILSTKDKQEFINEILNKISFFNLDNWLDMGIKTQKDYCQQEYLLDELNTFYLSGYENEEYPIVDLYKFRPIKKLTIFKTEMIGYKKKQLSCIIVNLNEKNIDCLEKETYDLFVSNYNSGITKISKKFSKIDWQKIKLSKQQKTILGLIMKGFKTNDIASFCNCKPQSVRNQIKRVKSKIPNITNNDINFIQLLQKIINHMDKQNNDFSRYIRYYFKKIKQFNFDIDVFLNICDKNLDKIENRKLYGALKWDYKIGIELFCKIRNNIEAYIGQ